MVHDEKSHKKFGLTCIGAHNQRCNVVNPYKYVLKIAVLNLFVGVFKCVIINWFSFSPKL